MSKYLIMRMYFQNALAVLIGIISGAVLNGFVIEVGNYFIAPPEGYDMSTPEGLNGALKVMEVKHFIAPFLAHAAGTLFGAFLTLLFVVDRKVLYAYVVSGIFFLGGLYMVIVLKAPMWFNVVDLVFAYLPMSWLAIQLHKRFFAKRR